MRLEKIYVYIQTFSSVLMRTSYTLFYGVVIYTKLCFKKKFHLFIQMKEKSDNKETTINVQSA